jgi:hypothetical protein
MAQQTPGQPISSMHAVKLILLAGFVAGIMDGSAAMIQTYLAGRTQAGLFRYIASGVFGNEAFTGSSFMIVWGIGFHMAIATLWATVFFYMYPYLLRWVKNTLAIAVLYGLFVWTVMNRIVLPLANTPKNPFNWEKAAIAAAVLIVCIGLPLSLLFSKYYKGK